MTMALTKPIKAETRLRPASGGWIPPTETGHSVANPAGFTLVEAAIALLKMLIVTLGSGRFVFGSTYISCR